MFGLGVFDHRVGDKSNIVEMGFEYSPELHERDDDYPLSPEVMTIDPEITGEKQHNLRTQYFKAACRFSGRLICSFLSKKHYVVLWQQLRFYLDRRMRLVKVHSAIRFNSSAHVAGYIKNNTTKRKQYKHDKVKNAFYKLINNTPYRPDDGLWFRPKYRIYSNITSIIHLPPTNSLSGLNCKICLLL